MCDSMAATPNVVSYGKNLIAKVDDRQMGEAEPLQFFPAADHTEGDQLVCTRITIPQVAHTYAMIGSKIWWMWGFEMGINEHGVVVVYNAEHSVMPQSEDDGLMGMDLTRLALERGKTAYEAMHVITDLLEKYGQNGNTHIYDHCAYESGYLISDAKEIWRLETAGSSWIAKRVEGACALTNCYGIETEFDECSEGLVEHAIENKLISPNEPFNFAKAYNEPAIWYARALPRGRRVQELLDESIGKIDFACVKNIMRDHFEDTIIEPRYGVGLPIFPCVCMHGLFAGNAKADTSIITTYHDDLGTITRCVYSTACTSAFIPVYWTGYLPELMQRAGEKYSEDSLWWTMEWLGVVTEMDYDRYIGKVRSILDPLEAKIEAEAVETENKAAALIREGKKQEAYSLLNALMDRSVNALHEAAKSLSKEIYAQIKAEGGPFGPRAVSLRDIWIRDGLPL